MKSLTKVRLRMLKNGIRDTLERNDALSVLFFLIPAVTGLAFYLLMPPAFRQLKLNPDIKTLLLEHSLPIYFFLSVRTLWAGIPLAFVIHEISYRGHQKYRFHGFTYTRLYLINTLSVIFLFCVMADLFLAFLTVYSGSSLWGFLSLATVLNLSIALLFFLSLTLSKVFGELIGSFLKNRSLLILFSSGAAMGTLFFLYRPYFYVFIFKPWQTAFVFGLHGLAVAVLIFLTCRLGTRRVFLDRRLSGTREVRRRRNMDDFQNYRALLAENRGVFVETFLTMALASAVLYFTDRNLLQELWRYTWPLFCLFSAGMIEQDKAWYRLRFPEVYRHLRRINLCCSTLVFLIGCVLLSVFIGSGEGVLSEVVVGLLIWITLNSAQVFLRWPLSRRSNQAFAFILGYGILAIGLYLSFRALTAVFV